VDALVLVDLQAEGAGAAVARPAGVLLGRATADIVVLARPGLGADIPVVFAGAAAGLRLALEQRPRAGAGFEQRPRCRPAGLQDDVDHAAHVLAAIDDRGRAAHDLDALDIGDRQLGDVGGAGAMAVDPDQHLAPEVEALALGRGAADVDRGLAGGPFA